MLLKTKDKNANFELIETYQEGARTFSVVSSGTVGKADALKKHAEELGYSYLGTCVRDGKPSVAFSTDKSESEVTKELSQGVATEEVKVATPPNMWFIRGFMGFTGQLFNLAQATLMGDKALGSFAYLNLGANGMAMALGAQKKADEASFDRVGHEFDQITAPPGSPAAIAPELADHQHQKENLRPKDLNVQPGIMGALRANSVKIQHTLRLVASAIVTRDGWKQYKNTGKVGARLIAGGLILPGKVIGILAKDEDPNLLPQEKKGFWENFKVNANQIGSLIELTGFTLMAYEGISTKKVLTPEKIAKMSPTTVEWSKKLKADVGWMQAVGQSLFVASYMVQSVAPLSKKVFPMERALQSASLHLQTLPDDKHDQAMVEMANAMYKTVPRLRREGMAKTLAQISRVADAPDQISAASALLSGKETLAPNTGEISPPPRVNQTELASSQAGKPAPDTGQSSKHSTTETNTVQNLAADAVNRSETDSVSAGYLAKLEEKRSQESAQKPVLSANESGWQGKLAEQEHAQVAMAK